MYAIYGNIYHPYTPNVSIYTIHGSYGIEIHEHSSSVDHFVWEFDEFLRTWWTGNHPMDMEIDTV